MNKLQKIKTACSHISLIDKFLLFFLFLFLVQIVYGLFSASESSVLSNSVDIIIRTYASAVFGYFLSGRFSGPSSINVTAVTSPIMTPNPPSAPSSVRNKIGFSDLPAAKAASADTALRTLSAPRRQPYIPDNHRRFGRYYFPYRPSHPAQHLLHHRDYGRSPHTTARHAVFQHRISRRK